MRVDRDTNCVMESGVRIRLPRFMSTRLAGFCPWGPDARARSLFGDIIVIVFFVVQFLDGLFTYFGVQTFGPSVEANPVMAWLMLRIGEVPALAGAKVVAISFGIALHLTGVHHVVAVLTGLYFALAIIPWANILFF